MAKKDEPLHVLKTIFGYDSSCEGQKEAIQNIPEGKDCVILMPTGEGKSLIFTIAAICKQELTVIIEPLKVLIEEQVATLREKVYLPFTSTLLSQMLRWTLSFTA